MELSPEKQAESDAGWADLHVHTAYSDGLLGPAEMVRLAKESGLRAVGIADHDTIDGLEEALEAGGRLGMEVVPAVELSSHFQGKDVHILGYFFDPSCPTLAGYLALFRQERRKRAERIVRNLNGAGVEIGIDEVSARAHGHCIGRPHIAEVLVERGYADTIQKAFQKYIGYGSEAYEEKFKLPPEQAIRLITGSRGLAVLAHPGAGMSETVITGFVKHGLDGIEVVHPFLPEARQKRLSALADRLGLLKTGGSDCHGGRDGQFLVGRHRVPYASLARLYDTHRSRYGETGFPWKRPCSEAT
jgi:hypothetical protein